MKPDELTPPENGACKGRPTHWWFPVTSRTVRDRNFWEERENKQNAIEICRSCIGRIQCLEYALYHEPDGIWGGLDEYDRDRVRVRRGIVSSRRVNIRTTARKKNRDSQAPAEGN